MKKITLVFILHLCIYISIYPQQYAQKVQPTKNLIIMIPDGTSMGVVSSARWYQIYNKAGGEKLAIDPYICGTVKIHSSDGPIPGSAPAMSCYMTGMPQRAGNIAIYPETDKDKDVLPLDPAQTYQPLATILEAAKYKLGKSTGLVVTVEFPHATPAACAAHTYSRKNYDAIALQMAHNNLDVMIGGGNLFLTDEIKHYLRKKNTSIIQDDLHAFRDFKGKEKLWALFCEREMPYDLDRNSEALPSLEEMTEKAIERLSKDQNGFFLMVEGSKVDWAAHANDPIACITEYLAFDRAVQAAIDFAKKDGETTVVVLPDHGNSGFSLGRRDFEGYEKAGLDASFKNVSKFKKTAEGLEQILLESDSTEYKRVFKQYMDIELSEYEKDLLHKVKNKQEIDYMKMSENMNMISCIVDIMNKHTFFGFTSGGHTGEDVFLSVYHPKGNLPLGMNTGIELNGYLSAVLGSDISLNKITSEIFVKHTQVFDGMEYSIDTANPNRPVLKVKSGKNVLEITAYASEGTFNKKHFNLESVCVYMNENNTFYVPQALRQMFR